MQRCNHQEADTRIAVYVLHALNKGHNQVPIRTLDTDIVVMMIGLFMELLSLQPSANVWLSLGMGKQFHLEQCPCFIPLLLVTPPLASRARERNPLGKLRSRIVRLQMRSFILLITHITTCTGKTATSSCLSVLLWFSMIKQAIFLLAFYILHLIFMISFIYYIQVVPIKLFVCIIGVLASTRFEINLPKWYLVQKPAVVSNPAFAR